MVYAITMANYLEQFNELRLKVPHIGLSVVQNENSPFCQYTERSKNCYMTFASYESEDCMYNHRVFYCRDCVDCTLCNKCELCYGCVDCITCYNTNYSVGCEQVVDSDYCYFSVNLQKCFGCVSIKGKQHCIFNKQYTPADYEQKVAELKKLPKEKIMEQLQPLLLQTPRPAMTGKNNTNSYGDHLYYATNAYWVFDSKQVSDSYYIYHADDSKDLIDCSHLGWSENCYQIMSGGNLNNCTFCYGSWNSYNLDYCELVYNSHDCFMCVGLSKKEFQILNQPYAEADYKTKVAEIIAAMQADGTWGKWYPSTFPEVITYGL